MSQESHLDEIDFKPWMTHSHMSISICTLFWSSRTIRTFEFCFKSTLVFQVPSHIIHCLVCFATLWALKIWMMSLRPYEEYITTIVIWICNQSRRDSRLGAYNVTYFFYLFWSIQVICKPQNKNWSITKTNRQVRHWNNNCWVLLFIQRV